MKAELYMKNLLFVTNESSHGGAERMLIWLANSIADTQKYRVFFCNLAASNTFYPLNENVIFIKGNSLTDGSFIYRNTIGFIKKTSILMKLIKNNKIDAVINFNDHAFYNLLVCKFLSKVKLIVSQRVDPASIDSTTGKIRLKLLKFCNGLVCQTDSAKEFFNSSIQEKSVTIPNPIYNIPESKWSINNTYNYIINVSRIELKQKRQDILLKAFALVLKEFPEIKLKMFGSKIDFDYEKMCQLINELNLNNNVEYCGVSDNITSEMIKARLFVLSSDYEGIPNAVLEAMALGMPIISTDCKPGGAKMLLENNCGILVERGDYKKLSEEIINLLKKPDYCTELGCNALKSVCRFDEHKICTLWSDYFDQILD